MGCPKYTETDRNKVKGDGPSFPAPEKDKEIPEKGKDGK